MLARRSLPVLLLALTASLQAQRTAGPSISLINVPARQAFLKTTTDARIRDAVAHLGSCVKTPFIPAPTGRIEIPHHYLSGSHGPTNPAEAAATKVYSAFETRINAGENQYVANGNEAEAKCALDQLSAWAKVDALMNYDAKASSQSWFQAGWTLCTAGIVDNILLQDRTLDPDEQAAVTSWLSRAAHRLITQERPGEHGNNLHYWRALAATAIGADANDRELLRFGFDVYREAIGEIDMNGALPREMERHERAIHYQAFALQPLVLIAEFGQHTINGDFYAYSAHGKTLRDAIVFLGQALEDPTLIKQYTPDAQDLQFGGADFAPFEFLVARFGNEGLPAPILKALQQRTSSSRIGGSATVLAAK